MKLPLQIDGASTVRDDNGRVIISAMNPCTVEERRQIVRAINGSLGKALRALDCVVQRLGAFDTSGLVPEQMRLLSETRRIAYGAIAACKNKGGEA